MATEVIQPPPQRRIIGPQTNIYLDELTNVSVSNPTVGDSLTFNGSEWVAATPAPSSPSGGAEVPYVLRLEAEVNFDGTWQNWWTQIPVNYPGRSTNAYYNSTDNLVAIDVAGHYVMTIHSDVVCLTGGQPNWPATETMLGTLMMSMTDITVLGNDTCRHYRDATALTQPTIAAREAHRMTWTDRYLFKTAYGTTDMTPASFAIAAFARRLEASADVHTLTFHMFITLERVGGVNPQA